MRQLAQDEMVPKNRKVDRSGAMATAKSETKPASAMRASTAGMGDAKSVKPTQKSAAKKSSKPSYERN